MWPREREKIPRWSFRTEVFSPAECRAIVERGRSLGLEEATVNETGDVERDLRSSRTAWIPWTQEDDWIFARLASVAREDNEAYFGLDLSGFLEPIQFTEYTEGQFYSWHRDMGSGKQSIRKLSQVVHLSPQEAYAGGRLEIFQADSGNIPHEQGSVVCFPSFEVHQVAPVTRGTRYSLVCWISGPALR